MTETPGIGALWLSGGRGAGKSTIARLAAARLVASGVRCEVLDEADLTAVFGPATVEDLAGRVVWLATMLQRHGVLPIIAINVPGRDRRDALLALIPNGVEAFVDDITAPEDSFESPIAPALTVPVADRSPDASAAYVVSWIEQAHISGRR